MLWLLRWNRNTYCLRDWWVVLVHIVDPILLRIRIWHYCWYIYWWLIAMVNRGHDFWERGVEKRQIICFSYNVVLKTYIRLIELGLARKDLTNANSERAQCLMQHKLLLHASNQKVTFIYTTIRQRVANKLLTYLSSSYLHKYLKLQFGKNAKPSYKA